MSNRGKQAATDSVVLIEDMSFSYNGAPVLTNVSAHINRHDFVSVVGPNGGGKTTLLKLILGLLRPDHGTIRVFGRSPGEARPRVGYVTQHFDFDPRFPVRVIDVVLMGRLSGRLWGRYTAADRESAVQALREVELGPMAGRHFAELSGGQRQRVLIARSLATEPEMLLLDEPTAHVDMAAQKDLYAFLRKLNQRLTIMMVTHDVGFVAPFVKSVLCVNRNVAMHPTQDITGEVISKLYGSEMRFVSHDHTACPHPDECERCATMRREIDSLRDGHGRGGEHE